MTGATASPLTGRIALGLIGLAGGAAAWALRDVAPGYLADAPRQLLFLRSLAAAFFATALALAGPLRLWPALAAAAVFALPLAGLMTWASLRFDTVAVYLDTGHPVAAVALLWFLPLPFLIAAIGRGTRWSDYAVLFDQSWMIVVRFTASWLFVGLVWAVLFLSNALLEIVGIDLIARLIARGEIVFLLSGLTLGLALAVVGELSDYISSELLLLLLRLLLPVVLVVIIVFLGAVPFRGLTQLFGEFSAAGLLLAMAFGATMLISSGLDTGGEDRPVGRLTCFFAWSLSLLLPALAGLALFAIWLRVQQYGLTPDRVFANALAGLALGYGLAYAASLLGGRGWAARIRRANVLMALVAIATFAAVFTPVLNLQKIAADNQVARFATGKASADELDLWTIGRDWGPAGAAALAQLAALTEHPEATRLAERLALLNDAESRHAFDHGDGIDDGARARAEIASGLPVRPEGATLPGDLLESLRPWELQQIAQACRARTANGNPACVALVADFSEPRGGDEVLVVAQPPGSAALLRAYFRNEDAPGFSMRSPEYLAGGAVYRTAGSLIDALIDGTYSLEPVPLNALQADGRRLFFGR
ncbi:putative transport [Rhodovulum sp. P5]|uniref:DUF4153 domain-containing protein n=1 Tax=Rhodovulum sp. P5 TaxID=1564506 RepID=UPI0009C276E0|nr:DUF4153 domain-containing protein [Rhodovulum sp. P5]ARE39616.1 putative transport [Rhodovulum sp. P5]